MRGLDLVEFTAQHCDGVISCTPVDRAERFFDRLLEAGQVIPKFQKGKLVGFLAYYRTPVPQPELKRIPDWTLPEVYTYGPYLFVDLVVIHPKYRKTRTLEYFIDRVKKLKPYFHAGFWLEQDGVWHAQERAENMQTNCGILAFDKITGMLNGRANVISLSTLARIAQDNEFLLFPMKVSKTDLSRLAYPFIMHNDFHFETITSPFELAMYDLPEKVYVLAQGHEIGEVVDDEEAKTIRGSKKFWKQVVAPMLGMGGGAAGGALLGTMLFPGLGTLGGALLGGALGGAGGGALVGPMTGRAPTLGETLTGAIAGGVGGGTGAFVGPALGAASGTTAGIVGGGLGGGIQGLTSGGSADPGKITGGSLLGATLSGLGGGALGGAGTALFAPAAAGVGAGGIAGTGSLGFGTAGAGTAAGGLSGVGGSGLTLGLGSMAPTGAGGLTSASLGGAMGGTLAGAGTGAAAGYAMPSLTYASLGTPSAAAEVGGGTSSGVMSAIQKLFKGSSAGQKAGSMFSGSNLLGAGLMGAGMLGQTQTPDLQMPGDLDAQIAAIQNIAAKGGMTPQAQAAGQWLTQKIPTGNVYDPVSDPFMQAQLAQSRESRGTQRKAYETQLGRTAGGPFSSEYNQLMGEYDRQSQIAEQAYITQLQEAARQQNANQLVSYIDMALRGDANAYQALMSAYGDRATADFVIQQYNAARQAAPWSGLQNLGGTILGNSINPMTNALMSRLGV